MVACAVWVLTFASARAADVPVVRVTQDAAGDFHGATEEPILQALASLAKQPGIIDIGPGEYLIRRELKLPSGTTLRGSRQTVLRLSPPTVVRQPAPAGQDFLLLDDTRAFVADTKIQIVVQDGKPHTPGDTTGITLSLLKQVLPDRLVFDKPLPNAVPAGSLVGSTHNLIHILGSAAHLRIEKLTLDGGRKPGIVMPGHVLRCAILGEGPFRYQKGPTAPPIEDLCVADCTIRNCHGRAVALYSAIRCKVTGCLVEDIGDESIDLDHFCYHCEVIGNTIRRGDTGVTINDGSYCLVAKNRIEQCGVGVTVWWWHDCPQTDIDVENVVRDNVVRQSRGAAISIGKRCYRNQVFNNDLDGKLTVIEADNLVHDNRVEAASGK
jgi:hypothetical protein